MSIEAGLILPPPNYDPEEAARAGGYTRDEIKQAVTEANAIEEAEDIAEAIEESSQDPRRH